MSTDFRFVSMSIESSGVARLTMNRPEIHNAFNDVMIAELRTALDQIRSDSAARLLILQANGRNFSAGADLQWMQSMAAKNYHDNQDDAAQLAALMWELDRFPLPTIALVQGAAYGGAVGLIACCDIAFATADARFCLSEVKIGLIPAVISPYIVRAIGVSAARRYMLTAEPFTAASAQQYGLIHEIAASSEQPHHALAELAAPVIRALLANGPAALSACKRLIEDVSHRPLNPQLVEETARRIAEIRVSAEGQEGLRAFLEKRTPAWQKTSTNGQE